MGLRTFRLAVTLCRAILALACLIGGSARADAVRVAVAANFAAPMQAVAAAFERATGHKTLMSFGATGAFYAQIRNGAPFHALLAADDDVPARLEREGLAEAGSRFTYAIGSLVLWSARPGFVDGNGAVLRQGGFTRLALANPKIAPYGAAAMETLEKFGLVSALQPKFVLGENVAQAYQFVSTGNAELGFVALSQVMKEGRIASGSAWVVPSSMHREIRQDAVLLTAGRGNVAAGALLHHLREPATLALIQGFGYRP